MTSPANTAERIRQGSIAISHPALATLALEATPEGIAAASPMLLHAWADKLLEVAKGMETGASLYWASVAAALQSAAWEKSTGERLR